MENNNLKVLISAYACGPKWGSEIGMGWNWVISLSQYCQLTVVTELGFKDDIEAILPSLNLNYLPQFHYIDVGIRGRELFWKQGSFTFYRYYKKWQFRAFELSCNLVKVNNYDIIHQLNMIGFREPGYLWKIEGIPYVWGPVGGYNQFPWSFISMLNMKNLFYYSIKNIINQLQIKLLTRPKKAAMKADAVFAATLEARKELKKITFVEPLLLNETGCNPAKFEIGTKERTEILKILWVGKLQGLKALSIALHVISKLKEEVNFIITIIGDGPDEKASKDLAAKLAILEYCIWLGKVSNEVVITEMKNSDLLFFTSIKEGTPHVVMEAIENGLPVLCHDACGHGATINDQCGIKIPMVNFKTSINEFSKAIINISKNPQLLNRLSAGTSKRANELTWSSKAFFMFDVYNQIKSKYDKTS